MSNNRNTEALTVFVLCNQIGVVVSSQLPHLGACLAVDAVGANQDVPAERGAVGADCSDAIGSVLDVDQVLAHENLAGIFEILIHDAQQYLALAPGGVISGPVWLDQQQSDLRVPGSVGNSPVPCVDQVSAAVREGKDLAVVLSAVKPLQGFLAPA